MKLEPCTACGYPLYPIYEPNTSRVMAECHRCRKSFYRPDLKPISYAEWLDHKLEWDRQAHESKGQNFWTCVIIAAALLVPIVLQIAGFWDWLDNL
jgi:hypothetical protein